MAFMNIQVMQMIIQEDLCLAKLYPVNPARRVGLFGMFINITLRLSPYTRPVLTILWKKNSEYSDC